MKSFRMNSRKSCGLNHIQDAQTDGLAPHDLLPAQTNIKILIEHVEIQLAQLGLKRIAALQSINRRGPKILYIGFPDD